MEKKLILIFLISFLLFSPSLLNFFSHDDFFHLSISKVSNFSDLLQFFNLMSSPEGWGFYRPLTTQVFYSIAYPTGFNPLILHLISFVVFFMVVYIVYKLISNLSRNIYAAILGAFLYATSATHFGHLYFLGAFQELGLALFYFSSIYFFLMYVKNGKKIELLFSFFCFLGALASKEFAVTLPVALLFIYWYLRKASNRVISIKKVFLSLTPFILALSAYLFLHSFYYGIAQGDSYVWEITPRVINTIFWYILWSLNLPEMLVDFVGPGLSINPNLLKYYSNYIIPIFALFFILFSLLAWMIASQKFDKKDVFTFLFSGFWFLLTLSPVIFLPIHKFSYELTVPLFGIILAISLILVNINKKHIIYTFLIAYLMLSALTNILTYKTHWITQGGIVSEKTINYLKDNLDLRKEQTVLFYDTKEDLDLPWSPSLALKYILSDNNFSISIFNGRVKAIYLENDSQVKNLSGLKLRSRKLLYE